MKLRRALVLGLLWNTVACQGERAGSVPKWEEIARRHAELESFRVEVSVSLGRGRREHAMKAVSYRGHGNVRTEFGGVTMLSNARRTLVVDDQRRVLNYGPTSTSENPAASDEILQRTLERARELRMDEHFAGTNELGHRFEVPQSGRMPAAKIYVDPKHLLLSRIEYGAGPGEGVSVTYNWSLGVVSRSLFDEARYVERFQDSLAPTPEYSGYELTVTREN